MTCDSWNAHPRMKCPNHSFNHQSCIEPHDPVIPIPITYALVEDKSHVGESQVPSGKHTKNYGKSPCLRGKSTTNGNFQ